MNYRYGKIFPTAFTGSLYGAGPQVYSVLMYAISNAQPPQGLVEINPLPVAAMIGMSVEDVEKALQFLQSPDPRSRTEGEEGRRLVKTGSFEYRLVNFRKYRSWESEQAEYKAKWDRENRPLRPNYKHRKHKTPDVTPEVPPIPPNRNTASASVPLSTSVPSGTSKPISLVPQSGTEERSQIKSQNHNARYHKDTRIALHWLNDKGGRHYREVDANLKVISARLSETGVTIDGVKQMIDRQVTRWKGTPQEEYLRPETLFAKSKFDGYYAARELPVETRNNGQSVWELNKRAERLQEVLANHRANPEGIYGGEPSREQKQDFFNLTRQLEQLKREIATHE